MGAALYCTACTAVLPHPYCMPHTAQELLDHLRVSLPPYASFQEACQAVAQLEADAAAAAAQGLPAIGEALPTHTCCSVNPFVCDCGGWDFKFQSRLFIRHMCWEEQVSNSTLATST